MSPRENKFTFVMSDEEKAKLDALAASESRSVANWLRLVIETQFAAKFGDKPPKKKPAK